ncbi:CaiB/BaiF CoA transferase family protein [Luteimonas sp. A537]
MNTATAPLAGIRIADFTIHAAGPFCTHLLSQLGAECIKIESAVRPDAFRKPHAVYGRMTAATFDQVASNKHSVRLNLKKPEGVELAKRLVSISDAAAESFRPGVMKRLGLDFDSLLQVKPDLVMLSLSSSGQAGPDSHFAGYAPLFGAWGGLGWMSGYSDGPPMEMRHVMDHSAGFHAAVALMAALHQRRLNGQPQHIDIAARDVASAMIGDALVQASAGGTPTRPGNADLAMAPHGVYPTNVPDRWLTIAVRDDAEWCALVGVLGQDALADDPRFSSPHARHAHAEQLDAMLSTWLRAHDSDVLCERLQQAGVPAHVSWNMQDITADPHLLSRGTLTVVDDPANPSRLAVGPPARFSHSSDVGIRRGTPALGQDEDRVYGELLGLDSRQRADLEQREIIY